MGIFDRILGRFRDAGGAPPRAPDWLVFGLGNPGAKYAATRHNIGFRVLECLALRHGGAWRDEPGLKARTARIESAGVAIELIAPQTFMNRSGESVEAALERWPGIDPERNLLVVYDDLDLPTGRIRLRPRGGGGGHNGIGDILDVLDTKAVARLRFGVSRPENGTVPIIDWVLGPFTGHEEAEVLPATLERAADAVEAACHDGVEAAMGHFNAAPEA